MRRLCGGQSTGSGSGGASAPSRATWTRCATSSTSSRGCPWLPLARAKAITKKFEMRRAGASLLRCTAVAASRPGSLSLLATGRVRGCGRGQGSARPEAPEAGALVRLHPSTRFYPQIPVEGAVAGARGACTTRAAVLRASARTIRVGPAPSPRTSYLEWQPSPRGRNGARSTARERALSDVTVLASPLERLGSLARSRRPPSTGNQRANGGPGRRGAGARGRRAGGAHAQDAHRDTRSVPAAGREIKAVPPRLRRGDAVETRRGAAAAVDADRGDERRGVRPPPSGTRRDDARLAWFLHRWNAGVALVLTW